MMDYLLSPSIARIHVTASKQLNGVD